MKSTNEGGNATPETKPRARQAAKQSAPSGPVAALPETTVLETTGPPPAAPTPAANVLAPGNYRCKVKDRSIQTKQGVAAAYSEVNLSAADAQRFKDESRVSVLYAL